MSYFLTCFISLFLAAFPSQTTPLADILQLERGTPTFLFQAFQLNKQLGRKFSDENDWIGIYKGKWDGGEMALVIRKSSSGGWNVAMQDNARKSYYESDFKELPFDGTRKNKLRMLQLSNSTKQITIIEMTMNINDIDRINGSSSIDNKNYQFYCTRN